MIRLSKEVSYLLRHTTLAQADPNGWVPVPLLQQQLRYENSYDDIKRMVVSNDKKRFVLDEESDPPRIRAVQGHSVELEQPLVDPVKEPGAFFCLIHTTSEDSWRQIQESGELKRMTRTHVHFASSSKLLRRNSWATVMLKLDLVAAMGNGIQFYRAANDVVLSEGPIPVQYLTRIENRDLPKNW